ncbi:T-kininogen 2-like [Mixophyes fleayi]|uniref:T-kininogen 2-like n=1 Tax=Mixophyes fleayi TaxID=3061075 RepID=UPI003F4D826E
MRLLHILLLCLYCLLGSANQAQTIDAYCDDSFTFEAVDEVLRSYNNAKGDGNQFVLNKTTDAKIKNEDDGLTHYFVTFEIVESVCAVKSGIHWQGCAFKECEADNGTCSAHVLINTKLKTKEVLSRNCSTIRGGQLKRKTVAEPTVTIVHKPVLGSYQMIDTNNMELSPLVQAAIEKMNKEGSHRFHFGLEGITEASRQVVSGWNYKLKYNVRQTNCSKHIYPNWSSEECKLDISGQGGNCSAHVFVTPKGQMKDISLQCSSSTGFCLSCPNLVETNDPELLNLLNQFVKKYNSERNHTNLYKVFKVSKATRKLVADKKTYDVKFITQETNCSKSDHFTLGDDCAIQPLGGRFSCDARIDVTNETVNILPDYTCGIESSMDPRITLKGFSPFRGINVLDRYIRASEKSKGKGNEPHHREETHGKKEKEKDKGKKKHDNKNDHSSEESTEKNRKKPEVPPRHPQYQIPKVPETNVKVLVTTVKQPDKTPGQPVTQIPIPFLPNLSPSTPLIPAVPEHQETFPDIHEMVLIDLPAPANVLKCPGKLWQPVKPVLQIITEKPFVISDFDLLLDDLAPPETALLPGQNQPRLFNDEDLI